MQAGDGSSSTDGGDTSSAAYVAEEGKAGAAASSESSTTPVEQKQPANPLIRPTHFRTGILQMVLEEQNPEEQIRVKVVAQIVGDVHHTFAAIDSDGNDFVDKTEFRELIRQLTGGGMPTEEIQTMSDAVFK